MTPGCSLLLMIAILAATLAGLVEPKQQRMTKVSEAEVQKLRDVMETFYLALESFEDSVEDQMYEAGVTLPPETVGPTTVTTAATTTKAAEATTATTTTTKAAETTTLKKSGYEQESPEEEESGSGQKNATSSEQTHYGEATTLHRTVGPRRTIPPLQPHRGGMYTKPGSASGRCYCEEITDEEASGDHGSGRGEGSSSRGKGGKGSSSRGKGSGEGSSSRGKGSGEGSSSRGKGGSGGGSSSGEKSGGGGSDYGEKKPDRQHGPCFPDLKNIAVQEGTVDLTMNVTAEPCDVAWTVVPTSNEDSQYEIIDSNCNLDSQLAKLYDEHPNGITIHESTTAARNGQQISTSGLYLTSCDMDGSRAGAKFVVVRSGPDCSCIRNSTSCTRLNCSVEFADGAIHPIPANMTWYVNGEFYMTDLPYRDKLDMEVWTATSIIEISDTTVVDYQCVLTFGEPVDIMYDFIATNAPEYSESCSSTCEDE